MVKSGIMIQRNPNECLLVSVPCIQARRGMRLLVMDVNKAQVPINDNINNVIGFLADEVALCAIASFFEKRFPDFLEEFSAEKKLNLF